MLKKLKPATSIPHFANDQEAAEFFETHDTSQIWDELTPVRPFNLPPEQIKAIRERYLRRKAATSLLLENRLIQQAKRIARRKSIGYQTQLRLWIAEGIRRESAARG